MAIPSTLVDIAARPCSLSAIGFAVKSGTPVLTGCFLDDRGEEVAYLNGTDAHPCSFSITGTLGLEKLLYDIEGLNREDIFNELKIVGFRGVLTGGDIYVGRNFSNPKMAKVGASTWLKDGRNAPAAGYEYIPSGSIVTFGRVA